LHDVGKLDELCYERAVGYTIEGQLLGHIMMEFETVSKAMDAIEGFPPNLKPSSSISSSAITANTNLARQSSP